MLKNKIAPSKELDVSDFENTDILFTRSIEDLKDAHFFLTLTE